MNIENLKNMPVMGEDPATSQIAQLGVAISAAAAQVREFGDNEEKSLVEFGDAAKTELSEYHATVDKNFTAKFKQDEKDWDDDYSNKLTAFNAAVANAESDTDPATVNSITEGVALLAEVDTELEGSLLNFLQDEQAHFDALKAEYGEVAAINNAIALI